MPSWPITRRDGWPQATCPLCKHEARIDPDRHGDAERFSCVRCGEYQIGGGLLDVLERRQEPLPGLSGVLRNACERGEAVPPLGYGNLAELKGRAETTLEEKARALLAAVARRSVSFGQWVALDPGTDYPIVYGRGGDELGFFLEHLASVGWIKHGRGPDGWDCTLTSAGWAESHRTESPGVAPTPGLSPEATAILKEAAGSKLGRVLAADTSEGFTFKAGGLEYEGGDDPRAVARYKSLVRELRKANLLVKLGPGCYELTHEGYRVADLPEKPTA